MKRYFLIGLCILSFTSSIAQHKAVYENIIFEGAGIRGLAYGGVIQELEKAGIMPNIKRVGGTSAGAITALMLSLGYTSQEIYTIISNTQFQKFNDGNFFFIGGAFRMKKRYGWYKGDKFNQWLERIIKDKTGNASITFEELAKKGFRELYVTGTCLNKQTLIVFSSHTYPHMCIKDAVRASMSVPLYFEAVFIDSEGKAYKNKESKPNLDIVVDGGIIGNFPIFIFDSLTTDSLRQVKRIANPKTIGVRIDNDLQIKNDSSSSELVPIQIDDLSDYIKSFYVLTHEKLNRDLLIPEDWPRTISVSSVGIGPKVKKLSPEQKASLVKSGETSTLRFLQKIERGK